MSELKKLLINVPDSYFDFVESLLDEAKKSEKRKAGLISFLKANPAATTILIIERKNYWKLRIINSRELRVKAEEIPKLQGDSSFLLRSDCCFLLKDI